ncbi:murein DD-endopeptidase MepM/ murein hydrolase activator NlpD [Arcanobacterium pluranimalium]|uniref:M23 family metallopeptidase n=1 Tax=Arcanobacterium pluranimalium TaxID=108028 RepID=UPI001958AF9B|nr:M23 family metallopeptidase [Arcanobacterium pluranimalium]MBM7825854.1 murein DD-endopeptidase MepM/ murein hydrolase activator NlpD [Arcanobacterium pluranimalium]
MTLNVNEQRTLPSRRELRLAAQRAEQAAASRALGNEASKSEIARSAGQMPRTVDGETENALTQPDRVRRSRRRATINDDDRARRLEEMLQRSQELQKASGAKHHLAAGEKPPVLALEESQAFVEAAQCEIAQEVAQLEAESVVEDASLDQHTQALPVLKTSPLSRLRERIAFNNKFDRSDMTVAWDRIRAASKSPVVAGTGILSAVALISTGVLQIQDAVGAQSSTEQKSILTTVKASTVLATPDTLLANDGAADGARLKAAEEVAHSAQAQCIPQTGANSLVGSFVSEESEVFMPMTSGTYRVSSTFGYRTDPFGLGAKLHEGQDFSAPDGTPFYAVADGTVLHAGEGLDGAASNMIVVQHEVNGKKFTSWYLHMWSDGILVKTGDKVKAGEKIGLVGSQGRSTGPHLHLEIHPGEGLRTAAVEPMGFLKELGARDLGESCK